MSDDGFVQVFTTDELPDLDRYYIVLQQVWDLEGEPPTRVILEWEYA